MKRYVAILVIILMISTLTPSYAMETVKDDITGHWAEETIEKWKENKLIKGYPDGTFRPDGNITKTEFIALVNRIYGYYVEADKNYTDVSESIWYGEDCKIAKANGYMDWYQEDSLNPEESILREEVFTILAIIMQVEATEGLSAIDGFTDKDDISDWSVEYVDALVESGYIKGNPDKTVEPQDTITRAEAVTMLDRVMGKLINKAGTYGAEEGAEVQTIAGNLTVNTQDVILQNMIIQGDLILAAGIGNGDVELNNVTVNGKTIINGGGENSITITGSNLGKIRVYKIDGQIRVVLAGSKAERVILLSGGKLEGEYKGTEIIIEPEVGEEVILDGSFDSIVVDSQVHIQVTGGSSIEEITFNAVAKVTGKGKIVKANINSNDVAIEQPVEKKETAEGVDGSGVEQSSPPPTGGSTGGNTSGGGYTRPKSSAKSIVSTTIGLLENGNITQVPKNTIVSQLKSALSVSSYATFGILEISGGSEADGNSTVTDNMVIEVKAENGSKAEYSIGILDATPPNISTASAIPGVNDGEIKLTASIDEEGTIYYIIVNEGSDAPSTDKIKAGKDSSDNAALSKGSAQDFSETAISGLIPGGSYDIYIVAEDKAGNNSNVAAISSISAQMIAQAGNSEADAHRIYTIEDLASIGKAHPITGQEWESGDYYILMNNLDFTDALSYRSGMVNEVYTEAGGGEGWEPIGNGTNLFTGTFDGNEFNRYEIRNLYIDRSEDYQGLFGALSGVIKNLDLIDVSASGSSYVGGLVGANLGTITYSYATGNVSGIDNVGGLVGGNVGTITYSYATGNVSGIDNVGGLVGANLGTITYSYATGNVSGIDNVGGLVGGNAGTITYSYATGNVSGIDNVGGLVGWNASRTITNAVGTIANSYATGNVSGEASVGGLVGWNAAGSKTEDAGSITYSYSTGDVNGSGDYVGGLVGCSEGSVDDSSKHIKIITSNIKESDIVAGLEAIKISIENDTFVSDFGLDNELTSSILNSMIGSEEEQNGWNNLVTLSHQNVFKLLEDIVIAYPNTPEYRIVADENVTIEIPVIALTTLGQLANDINGQGTIKTVLTIEKNLGYNAVAEVGTTTPTAGTDNPITLTVKKKDDSLDTYFTGENSVTISGVEQADDDSYGNFNGVELTSSSQTVTVNFTNGGATTNLKLNKAVAQTIGFSIEGVKTPATNSLTITPTFATVSKLMVSTQPVGADTFGGGVLATQPVVYVADQYGNTVTNSAIELTAAKKEGTGDWSIGSVTASAVNGVATFTGINAINNTEEDITTAVIVFTADGITSIESDTFTIRGVDIDGDGLSRSEEIIIGTDPNKIDTDDDGLTDGEEVIIYGTNPLEGDTDGDGLSDADEVADNTAPAGDMISPVDDAINVLVTSDIQILFNEGLDRSITEWSVSFATGGLTLDQSNATISYTTTNISNDTVTITPINELYGNTTYGGVTINGFEDLAGNEVNQTISDYEFKTEFKPVAYIFAAANGPNKVYAIDQFGNIQDTLQELGTNSSRAVVLGDVDNDLELDAVVANDNPQDNRIWLNDGAGAFIDSGQSLGSYNSRDIELGDLDNDGDLDVYVTTDGQGNRIWLNDGTGAFIDSGQSFGSYGMDIELGDVDNDGDLDAYVVNYGQGNKIWLNDGTGIFSDSGQSLGSYCSMDVDLGDVDNDGDIDAFVANYGQGNRIWLNNGTGIFSDSGQSLGSYFSMDMELGDIDNDGDLDAFVANSVETNRIWLNDGTGTFIEIILPCIGMCVEFVDIDKDNYLEIIVLSNVLEVWRYNTALQSYEFDKLYNPNLPGIGDIEIFQ